MNTPRLRRGRGDSFFNFVFNLYWYSYIVYCKALSLSARASPLRVLGFVLAMMVRYRELQQLLSKHGQCLREEGCESGVGRRTWR